MQIYAIEKSSQGNFLKRVLVDTVRGRGKADTLRDQGQVTRLGTGGAVRARVERLMRSGAYDEALAILDAQLAQTPERRRSGA